MRVNLDLEPTAEQIQSKALEMFGDDYFSFYLGLCDYDNRQECLTRVDMEHAAEQWLVRHATSLLQLENVCD